jgi:DNA-binding beta-propeller fold protein YncE
MGVFVREWGTEGSGDGQFRLPRGITVDDSSFVYVTDDAFTSQRVQKFTDTGGFKTTWGSIGNGDGEFRGARSIVTDYRGFVYVSDTLNDRIQKFTSTGTFILEWGQSGTGPGEFSFPIGVKCIADYVYVVDQGNHRVQLFDGGGGFVFEFGSFCQLSDSLGCVDPDGGGPLELGDGQFNSPVEAAVGLDGNLYVTDTGNHRVQKFGPPDVVGIAEEARADRVILRVFPNPSRFAATVFLSLPDPSEGASEERTVTVQVFDVAGRLVKVLFSGVLPEGDHTFNWDGSTRTGKEAPPGVFYIHVAVDGTPNRAAKIVRIP